MNSSFYNILVSAHSGVRWLLLLFLLIAIFQTFLILFFMSSKVQFSGSMMGNSLLRFFTVEHSLLMIIAIILITMGYSRAKKAPKPFNVIFNFYVIALILILIGIPWPFREALGAGWF